MSALQCAVDPGADERGQRLGVHVDAVVAPGVGERRHGAEDADGQRLGGLVADQAVGLGGADEGRRRRRGRRRCPRGAARRGWRRPARRRAGRSSRRARRGTARWPRRPGGCGSAGRRRRPSPGPGPCATAGASCARARRTAPAWSGSTSRRGPWRRRPRRQMSWIRVAAYPLSANSSAAASTSCCLRSRPCSVCRRSAGLVGRRRRAAPAGGGSGHGPSPLRN